MPEMQIPMLKGDKLYPGIDYRDALPVNSYAVLHPVFDVEGYMQSHPGLGNFNDSAPGRDRGAVYNERQQIQFRVSGAKLVRVDFLGNLGDFQVPRGSTTILGDISGEDSETWSEASMPYSFNNQLIVTDLTAWLYNPTDGLRAFSDTDLGDPIDAIWIDGYFFFTDGEYLYHTNINDETQIDPDNYATSEFSPDPTFGLLKTQDNQVMVMNRYTTEYFYNAGNEDGFAFQRIPAKAVKTGIVGTHLKCELGGNVFCLGGGKGESPTVQVISPGQVANIATREIDQIIGEYTEKEMADGGVMESRTDDRDQLVYIRLPRHTLLYNHAIAQKFGVGLAWSVLRTGLDGDEPWVGANGVYDVNGGDWVYGDRTEGRLGVLGNSSLQYGEQQEIIFYTPFVDIENASIDELEIMTIPGYTFEDSLPVFISMTYDGLNWGHEWTLNYGGAWQWNQRFIAYRMGYVRHWFAYKIRTVTPYRIVFSKMVIKYG